MRLLLLFCLSLCSALASQAQERVANVRMRVVDSSQLEIRYDLLNVRPGDSIYVEIQSRLRGLLRVLPEFVRGDAGRQVMRGSDRRIVWNALANGYSLNEEIRATIRVKTGLPVVLQLPRNSESIAVAPPVTDRPIPAPVKKPERPEPVPGRPAPVGTTPSAPVNAPPGQPAETTPPNPDLVVSRKTRYAGPAWALLSAVAPGFGNIFVQTPRPRIGFRPLVAVSVYSLLLYGLQERQKSRDVYAVYEQQKNTQTADPYYQTANDHYHRYYLATRGAIAVAAADVILTFFKGLRNGQAAAANRPVQSVTLRPGLQAGQLTAVARYSF